jgi:uncharacterized protein (DUF2147 family)
LLRLRDVRAVYDRKMVGITIMTMTRFTAVLAGMLAVATGTSAAQATARPGAPAVIGRWANPRGTLAVQTGRCADGALCGQIVWASPQARAEARSAGLPDLVGTQLLRGYRRNKAGAWEGKMFVPDMGRTFSSRIHQTSPHTLTITGCVVGSFLCKSQVWHRVA